METKNYSDPNLGHMAGKIPAEQHELVGILHAIEVQADKSEELLLNALNFIRMLIPYEQEKFFEDKGTLQETSNFSDRAKLHLSRMDLAHDKLHLIISRLTNSVNPDAS